MTNQRIFDRRSMLRSAAAGVGAAIVTTTTSACVPDERNARMANQNPTASITPAQGTPSPGNRGRVLLAYFSRAGENYYYGGRTDLDTGNTEVLVGMISSLITCDVHRIEAADPYPESYDATVARNVSEQNADARPAIANPLAATAQYETVLLASGIWNVRAPMIMTTFAESFDFTGKTIYPITTHAMSGLGNTVRDYARTCPRSTIGQGLAVQGEKVADAGPDIQNWLQRTGLIEN